MQAAEAEPTVIVVGAGPSGLATAACLAKNSIPYTIIEREDCVASLWQKKSYERLHLHLKKPLCQLPHVPFPSHLPDYVSRDDFVRYLDDYALRFRIAPLFNRTVVNAEYDGAAKRWRVKVKNTKDEEEEEYRARFLVVATGLSSDPYWPEVDGLEGFPGKVLHSTEYRTGKEFQGRAVLVVGAGNSGMEIALDLANYGATTSIVIRSPVNIMSRWMMNLAIHLVKYLSVHKVDKLTVILSRVVYGDLTKHGIMRPEDGPFLNKIKHGKFPVLDVGTVAKIQAGLIQVLPGIRSIRGKEVAFENDKSYAFDAIVFATGFRSTTKNWLMGDDYLVNDDGVSKQSHPNNWKGRRGLYCAGLSGRGLYGAGVEAQNIADDIKSITN